VMIVPGSMSFRNHVGDIMLEESACACA
jgi:hypothetical protein